MKLMYKIEKTTEKLWYYACRYQILSQSFIEKHEKEVAWDQVSFHQKMGIEFAEKYVNKLWWDAVVRNPNLSEEFIKHFFIKEDIFKKYMKGNSPETDKTNMGRSMAFRQMWWAITKHHKLSEEFIREYNNSVDWNVITDEYQHISFNFIRQFVDKFMFDGLTRQYKFTMKEMNEFTDELDWNKASKFQVMDEQFIRRNSEKILVDGLLQENSTWNEKKLKLSDDFIDNIELIFPNVDKDTLLNLLISGCDIDNSQYELLIKKYKDINWSLISKRILTEEFIDKYANKLDWGVLSAWQPLTSYIINKYEKKIDWEQVSMNYSIDENAIIDNIDKFNQSSLDFIASYRKLKESTIEKISFNKGAWEQVCEYQKLSENFIREHINDINWRFIIQYQILSEDFMREYKGKLDWDEISAWQRLSESFIWEFRDKLNLCNVLTRSKVSEEFIERLVKEYE